MDRLGIKRLLDRQCRVVSRRQLLQLGATDNDIQRMMRRRELARVFEGVYVDHTGPLHSGQRAWAAVLYAAPASLAGRDALHAHGVRGFEPTAGTPVHLVVPTNRRVLRQPSIRVQRLSAFDTQVQHHLSPPRLRIEMATLQVASEAPTEDGAVAVVSDVCQTGRSTAGRLRDRLRDTPRLAHRALLLAVLDDVASGAFSALERRFLSKVERAHGLPSGMRQLRVQVGGKVYYRDVTYPQLRTHVELDGRLGHERAVDRWADLERDLASAASGELTLRLGWLQVLDACRLAGWLARIFKARGWEGSPRRCSPDCSLT